MSNKLTLEHVEQLAEQLPLQEQLKLISRLTERLTEIVPLVTVSKKNAHKKHLQFYMSVIKRQKLLHERLIRQKPFGRCMMRDTKKHANT